VQEIPFEDFWTGMDASASRKGRPPKPLVLELVGDLTEDERDALAAGGPVAPPVAGLKTVTAAHHEVARMLATGKDVPLISLHTGYTTVYIQRLKGDALFKELLEYYGSQREEEFVDVLRRMNLLGIMAIDELQSRLADTPEKFSPREIMELAELMLVKGRIGPAAGRGLPAGQPAGVNVSVQFIQPVASNQIQGLVIEGKIGE
jgi:hypothetical protein